MTVSGYLRINGNCLGHTLSVKAVSHRRCADECDILSECKGYVYIFSNERPFKDDACTLKKKMCGSTIKLMGYNISVYYSTKIVGKLIYLL